MNFPNLFFRIKNDVQRKGWVYTYPMPAGGDTQGGGLSGWN